MIYKLKLSDKAKSQITKKAQIEIIKKYKQWSKEVQEQILYIGGNNESDTIKEYQYNILSEKLKQLTRELSNEVKGIIKSNMYVISEKVIQDEKNLLKLLGINNNIINISFVGIDKNVVESLITGTVYEGGWNLSKAIWGDEDKTLKDIYNLIGEGIAKNKSIYEIAKDVEMYTNPAKLLPWNFKMDDGKKIYKRKVDYNAQRLVRTLIQHTYQQTFKKLNDNNPLVEKYIWRSNGSRPCEICLDRDGREYTKDELPLDHPNGMCTMDLLIDNNWKEKLVDWVNSEDNKYPELDEWSREFGYNPQIINKKDILK